MSNPIFEWTFDSNTWPEKSFFGRRWVELWNGRVVEPANGCLYFWGCIISTFAWSLRGTFLFPFRKGYKRIERYVDEHPPTQKEQAARIHGETPKWLKFIGSGFHWVLATEYSPFRITAVILRNTIIVTAKFIGAIGPFLMIAFLAALLVIAIGGIAALLILYTWEVAEFFIIMSIVIAILLPVSILMVLIGRSGIFQLTWSMIKAGKDKVCPAVRIV